MKTKPQIICVMLFLVIFTSCTTGLQPSPIDQNRLTETSAPIVFPSPTATQSQIDKIFAIPTFLPYPENTPTSIATPHLSNSVMKLRDLSEMDLLQLIADLQEQSYQYSPPYGGLFSDSYFADSQKYVALVIQEFLFRFPNSIEAERLRWQLALIESVMYDSLKGNEYYDKWIVSQLQDMLNSGSLMPEDLESVLDRYWFDISYYQPVENLFGDQKTAWFYVIAPQVWADEEDNIKSSDYFYRGGLFVIVREISEEKFQIYILENSWSFSSGSSSLFEISDFNKNGISEIALNIVYHSGTMCGGHLKIFEWRDDSFLDLTRGNIQIRDCLDNYEYFLSNGVPSIRLMAFFDGIPEVYKWNGSYYEFSGYEYATALEKWQSTYFNDSETSFADEASAIEEVLALENKEGLSFAQIDFLRFRLGIVYALDSQSLKAREVLQDLAEHPVDTSLTVYSKFAKNFLKYYTDDSNLYFACKKSREIFDVINHLSSSEEEKALFGINFDYGTPFGPGLLRCFDGDVFNVLINKIPVSVENVPDELRKNGLKLYYAKRQDINLDGLVEEWLIVFDDRVYVILPDGAHYKSMSIDYFYYSEDDSKYSGIVINVMRWNGIQYPVLTVKVNKEFSIASIGENYSSNNLSLGYEIDNILISPNSVPAQFQTFYTKPDSENNYVTVPWSGYRWDSTRQEFRDDLLEYDIFVEHHPEKAVEVADVIMPLLLDWRDLDFVAWALPRYFYICGLSYELSGDSQKAAEIYWQLWRDFPESPYALMARFKLEAVNK